MNIMVTLKEIKKNNNLVSFVYFAESNDDDTGKILYDIKLQKVVDYKYCEKDKNSNLKTYFHKAVRAIEKCVRDNNFDEPVRYMWY